MRYCNKDCRKCKNLNGRVDNKGYPFAYECLKHELLCELTPKVFNSSKPYVKGD